MDAPVYPRQLGASPHQALFGGTPLTPFYELTGVLVLCAKLSDIFGRKTCLLASVGVFVVFSAACGGAQTMDQL